jgi:hypothetical protein
MDRLEASPASKPLGAASITVVGRFETSAGRIADFILDGRPDLKSKGDFEGGRLVQRTAELAKEFSHRQGRALAFVGIGFGPAPVSDFDRRLWKAVFDETKHPRVAEGSPEGGEFCSVDGTEGADVAENPIDAINNQNQILKDLTTKAGKRAARAILKARLLAGFRAAIGLAADIVPYAGELFDAYEIVQTLEDFARVRSEIAATKAFLEEGPKVVEELQVPGEPRSFRSANAFAKDVIDKYYGPAGPGADYHHIVLQGGANETAVPAELLHSTENMIKLPRMIHEEVTSEYNKLYLKTGKTLREYLEGQPYEVQREEGLKVLRKLGVIK